MFIVPLRGRSRGPQAASNPFILRAGSSQDEGGLEWADRSTAGESNEVIAALKTLTEC